MQGLEQDTEERHELVFPLKAYDALVDVDVLLHDRMSTSMPVNMG